MREARSGEFGIRIEIAADGAREAAGLGCKEEAACEPADVHAAGLFVPLLSHALAALSHAHLGRHQRRVAWLQEQP